MFSLGKRNEGIPSFAEFSYYTNYIRFMTDLYSNCAPPHNFPPIPHPDCFGGACRGPLEFLVEECICLIYVSSNGCCLPIASAQSGSTTGSPINTTIQFESNESSPNHVLESYLRIIPPESYPRIIPPIQTFRTEYDKK